MQIMKTYLAFISSIIIAYRAQMITVPVADRHLSSYDGNEAIDLLTLEDAKYTVPVLFGEPL